MPIGPVGTKYTPLFLEEYRAGRALADTKAPCPSDASPQQKAGWLILQPDAAARIADFKPLFAAIPRGQQRSCISAACQATLARTAQKPMLPNEAALMGLLIAINRD